MKRRATSVIERSFDRIEAAPTGGGTPSRSLTQAIDSTDWRAAMNGTRSQPENWLPIPGLEGWYDVSDHGRIRRSAEARGVGVQPGRVLSPRSNGGSAAHLSVDIYRDARRRKLYVHRAVAMAFLPKVHGDVVRHRDSNPRNNHVSNLAWGTQSDNMQDMLRAGRDRNGWGQATHCVHGHLFDQANTRISRKGQRCCRTCARIRAKTKYDENRARKQASNHD